MPVSSPSSAAVAGNVRPMTIVGGRTTSAVDRAKSRSASTNWADDPVDERVGSGEARIDGAERDERGRQQLRDGDQADDRADARPDEAEQDGAGRDADQEQHEDDVNTYVELPVPAPRSRFQTTW